LSLSRESSLSDNDALLCSARLPAACAVLEVTTGAANIIAANTTGSTTVFMIILVCGEHTMFQNGNYHEKYGNTSAQSGQKSGQKCPHHGI
jgi:hypothetical protein